MEVHKYEDASRAFERAVKLKPKFAEAHYRLGVTYLELSKRMLQSARKEYRTLRRLDKELAKELQKSIQKKK